MLGNQKASFYQIFLISFLLSLPLISADTDGVFDKAENLRGGIIGQDEQDVTSFYKFINPVITNNLTTESLKFDASISNCILFVNQDGSVVCDSTITTNQVTINASLNSFTKVGTGNTLVSSNLVESTNLIYDKNQNENSLFQIDSGLSTIQYSAIDFLDKGSTKWGLGKDNNNNFFIDEFGVANRFIIQKLTGNIGVDNPSPTHKLDVSGTSRISGKLTLNDKLEFTSINNCNLGINSQGEVVCDESLMINRIQGSENKIAKFDSNENIVSSKLEENDNLIFNNNLNQDAIFEIRSGSSSTQNSRIDFYDRSSNEWSLGKDSSNNFFITKSGTGNEITILKSNGNVGIGISNPSEKLEVNGKTKTTNLDVDEEIISNDITVDNEAKVKTYCDENGNNCFTNEEITELMDYVNASSYCEANGNTYSHLETYVTTHPCGLCGGTTGINEHICKFGDIKLKRVIRQQSCDTGCICFTEDTKVQMLDGSYKDIEDVLIGEFVIGKDGKVNEVLGYHRPKLGTRKLVSINGGEYFITEDHPLLTEDGWKSLTPEMTKKNTPKTYYDLNVTKLEVGDVLIKESGNEVIETLDSKHDDPSTQLYSLVVTGDDTFTVYDYITVSEEIE